MSITRLGITSTLLRLGKTARGALQVPKDFQKVGWYTGSARPGDPGPTVLVGHVDSYKGPGIFYNLSRIATGDLVRVTRADRSVASFRVTRKVTASKSRFPTAAVYGSSGQAALRLITCGGAFDRASGHYLSNTIVFASYVGATRPAARPRAFLVRGSAPLRPLPKAHPSPRPTAAAPREATTYVRHRAR